MCPDDVSTLISYSSNGYRKQSVRSSDLSHVSTWSRFVSTSREAVSGVA